MADGDVILDIEFEVDEPPGSRVKMFACEDSTRPGGYKHRFHHYHPQTGETLLRYDNSHNHPEVGWHHRHESEEEDPEQLVFNGLQDLINRFQEEVQSTK